MSQTKFIPDIKVEEIESIIHQLKIKRVQLIQQLNVMTDILISKIEQEVKTIDQALKGFDDLVFNLGIRL